MNSTPDLLEIHPTTPRIWYPPKDVYNKFDRDSYTSREYNLWKKDELSVLAFKSLILSELQNNPFCIRKNNFGYNIKNSHHYVLWLENTDYLNMKYINYIVEKHFPTGKIIIFENEEQRKSIKYLTHVHIISEYEKKSNKPKNKCIIM